MTSTDNELHLFLGRVEGKLDSVIAAQTVISTRLDRVDGARQALSERLSVLETRRTTISDWWALVISVCTALAVLYSNTKGLFH